MAGNTERDYWKQLFLELINIIENRAEYGDILLAKEDVVKVSSDFSTIAVSDTSHSGIKMRAFDGNSFVECHTTDFSPANLKQKAKELVAGIKKSGKRKQLGFIDKSFKEIPKINPANISLSQKTDFVQKNIAKLKKYPVMKNARVDYDEELTYKIFCSRNKFLDQSLSKVVLVIVGNAINSSGDTLYEHESTLAPGFEVTKQADKLIAGLRKNLSNILKSKRIKPGKYESLLSPEISGLLAHESFGHGMESDTVYKERAKAKEYIGKRIASSKVSIVDDPSLKLKHGSYFFDDEGQITSTTYLVKNGIVRDPITEKFSAKLLHIPRTGNGRCEWIDHKSYARMSNTFFGKGTVPMKKMLSKIKDGIYLIKGSGGMEDPKGWGVQIQGIYGQRIKNGKLVDEFFRDIGITGYLPTILGNILDVSKEFDISDTGFCGKGHKEWVPVSTGGSYLRIKDLDLA